MASRSWIRLDVGLLEDEGFFNMSAAERGAYITAYLHSAPRDGEFKSEAYLLMILEKERITDPAAILPGIAHMLEYRADGTVAIRNFIRYQGRWNGPSDNPDYKRGFMAARRGSGGEPVGSVGHPSVRPSVSPSVRPPARARDAGQDHETTMEDLADVAYQQAQRKQSKAGA